MHYPALRVHDGSSRVARRPAGPASSPSGARLLGAAGAARPWRAAACLLATCLALLLGAGAAHAQAPVSLVDIGGGCTGAACPDAPTGSADGSGDGQIKMTWTPATTGAAATIWGVGHRESGTTSFTSIILNDASARSHTFTGLDKTKTYDVNVAAFNTVSNQGDVAQASGIKAAPTPPTFSSAKVNGNLLTITFNEGLAAGSSAATGDFFVTVGTSRRNATGIAIAGATVTLTLASAVTATDTVVKVRYTQGTNRLKDAAGNEVASFTDKDVTNVTGDTTPPTFSSAAVNGKTLTVTFNENLDTGSTPAGSAFTVSGGRTGTGMASISGATATVTLPSAVEYGQTVTVSYTKPSSNPLQDAAGNPVATFSNKAVTNNALDPNAPTFSSAWVNGRTLQVFFNPDLDPDSAPAGSAFTVRATSPNGGTRIIAGRGTVDIDGATNINNAVVTVTLESLVKYGERVTVSYARPASGSRLRSPGGSEVEDFSGKRPVLNKTPAAAAVFSSAAVRQGAAQYLSINFTEVLDGSSEPPDSAFTVRATSPNGRTRTIRGASNPSSPTVNVSGSVVYMELASAVEPGEKVTLSYRKPRVNPLRDAATETELESFSGVGVANGAPRIESVAIVSDPGADDTYGERDTIRVEVRFSAPVTVLTQGGTPRLMIKLLSFDRDENHRIQSRWAAYEGGTRSETLTFAYEVGSSDNGAEGVGVRWNAIDLNGGRIGSAWAWPREEADLSQEGLDHDLNHKVNGRLSPPKFASATVDGATLRVTFDENLDTGFVPAASAFRVTVNGARRPVASGGVAIEGATVRLTLTSAVRDTDTVKVRYAKPSRNGLRDAAGNEVESFADRDVAGDETPPVFSSAAVDGATLTLTFNETLDTGSVPAPGDFHVTVGDARRNVAAGGVSISGRDVTLTLASAVTHGDTVKARYTRPARNGLRDAAGNEVASCTDKAVTNETPAPDRPASVPENALWWATLKVGDSGGVVLGCLPVPFACSTHLTDDSFTRGDVTYQVTSVYLEFDFGTSTTIFRFRLDKAIPQGVTLHVDGRQFPVADATLSNGDQVASWTNHGLAWSNNQEVQLALTESSGDASGNSGNDPASVTGVAVVSSAGADKTYGLGDTIHVRATFDETVDVTGSPRIKIKMDPGWGEFWADYESGSGTNALTFAYTVAEPNTAPTGIAVLANTLQLNGGTIQSGGADADLAHTGLGHDSNHKVDWKTTPEGGASGKSGPTRSEPASVTGVAVVSSPAADKTYGLGEKIQVRATFSDRVNVTGSPRLKIKMDPRWGEFWADYESGRATSALTFAYTVAEPNTAPSGIAVLANTLELNGGTIRTGGTDADLAHAGLGHDSNHKVDWKKQPGGGPGGKSGPTHSAPTFDGGASASFSIAENHADGAAVGTVAATDADGDALTYSLAGEDAASFAIGAGGAIAVRSGTTLDYEGKSSYSVTARVTDGEDAGGNAEDAPAVDDTIAVTVEVTNVEEPPGAPTGVSATAASASSLSVSWTAPGDTGALAVAGYELRWHAGEADPADEAAWTQTGDVGAGTTATIENLTAETAYRVQARARADGTGPWSASGAGRTSGRPPEPESATIDGRAVTVTFDEELVAVGEGESLHFYLTVTGAGVEQSPVRASASGRTVTAQLGSGSPARAGRTYSVGYFGGGLLRDAAGNAVARFSGLAAENLTLPALSVADARVEEGASATLDFAVTLDAAPAGAVTVDYATADGSARAGEDYTAASGTLTFQAGESSKAVSVAVLDDEHDEGEETLKLRLSNPSGATLADGEATGTIVNRDLMPAALLARFGRATAEHVVDQVEERMVASREGGFRARLLGREYRPGMERDFARGFVSQFGAPTGAADTAGAAAAGGAALGGAATTAASPHLAGALGADTTGMGGALGAAGRQPSPDGGLFGSLAPGGDLLSRSEFELNRASHGGVLSLWSRSSRSSFNGIEEALSLNGDVRTTMVGADWARGPLTVGLSVGHTRGAGGYDGRSAGQMTTAMTGFYPWLGYRVNDRVSVWAVTGYGKGSLSLTPDGAGALETGMSMAMTAVGTRGELLGSRAAGGFGLAFKADALWVGATSELLDGPAGRLNASEAGATRVRTALEGSRGFALGGGRVSLTPSVEVGLRRDGGDAETGAGLDLGGGVVFTDSVMGLSLDARVRTLVMHQAEGFAERGMSLSLGWDPSPSSPLGLSARVAPSWGGSAMGGAEALWSGQLASGPGSQPRSAPGGQVNAEAGYGLPVGARFVGTPRVGVMRSAHGREYRVGTGLGVLESGRLHFDLGLDARRRENPMQGGADNGFLVRATLGW